MVDEASVNVDRLGQTVLSPEESLRRLGEASIGRIGFVDAGSPIVLPVNFTIDGHNIVFRSGPGSKLASAIMRRPVCFEVDGWDTVAENGWSVLVKGVADEVTAVADVERLDALSVRPWAHPELRTQWVRIRADEISGRSI
jgi:nitroimidazol reductase NimA-like FMN-containing flavoprotein (pyridoxamine 5'-phosphate oxidase superfamily)